MAGKGWTIVGVSDETRNAVSAAAKAAGLSIGAWAEQAFAKALKEGLEPPATITADQVREIIAEEVRPIRETLAQPAPAPAGAAPASPVERARDRIRARRFKNGNAG